MRDGSKQRIITRYVYGQGFIGAETSYSYLYHHYNHLGSTMKLTDESSRVVACYTYGTYGELLSGDTTLTSFLYNGRCGVSTDDNGLYYMRQRYYNPEIKRFVNQDILAGSLANSQSLNRYSYVQGNPVSYTDPFGLAPESEMSVGSMIAHGVLGIVGMVPGWVGAVANLADAAVYAFVDHDYGMMAVSLVNAFSMGATKYLSGAGKVVTGAGKVVQVGSQATKVSKGVRYAYVISELISNGATFVTAANNTMDIGFHMYEKYEIQGRSYDENTIYEGASLLMNIFTMGMSGNGMIHHGKALGKMIEAENIGGRFKNVLSNNAGRADIRIFAPWKWGEMADGDGMLPGGNIGRIELAGQIHPVSGVRFDSNGFPIFDAKHTVKLEPQDYMKTRGTHSERASKALYNEIMNNANLRSQFTIEEIEIFKDGGVPKAYTWHHHQDEGVMQLVDRKKHRQTGHTGGFSIWGPGN